jgi:HD domain
MGRWKQSGWPNSLSRWACLNAPAGPGGGTPASATPSPSPSTACLPDLAAKTVREAVAECEARNTPEAICAHDADKLECLLQAIEYQAAGNVGVQGWIDTSRRGLTTTTAQRIADAALSTSPLAWRGR